MRVAVAATASFGADVLERLAAGGTEIAYLLTRPDAPRGRGRRLAPPPAKETAERARHPRRPARAPGAPPIEPVDAVVVCAYGLLIPETLLARALWLNVHPSLLPRWRGAAPVERAILAGDEETGVTIHETVEGARRRARSPREERFPIAADDDAGADLRPRGRGRGAPARGRAPRPVVHAAARGGRHVRRQDHAGRPRARPRRSRRRLAPRPRALAAHRRLGGPPRPPA